MSDSIQSVETFIVSIPRDEPYLGKLESGVSANEKGYFVRPGNRSIYSTADQSLLIKVTSCSGVSGWGECVAFVAPEAPAAIINEVIGPLIQGRDPMDVIAIYEDLYDGMRVRGFFGGFYHDALAALDIALWDLKGKLTNLPVCQLLGARRSKQIPAYVSGLPMPTLEGRVELAREWVERGFSAIKFAAAVSHEGVIEEMRALREALGPKVKLLVDLHWKHTPGRAIELIRQLEAYDLHVAEAPVRPEDIEGQARVVRSVQTPVGIGEELRTVHEFRPRFTHSCMDVIQPEMGRTGITAFWQIAQLATAFNCEVMPHASIGIGIFQAASLHATAALGSVTYHEYQHSIFDKNLRFLTGNMSCGNGFFNLPEGSGLGVEPADELFRYIKK